MKDEKQYQIKEDRDIHYFSPFELIPETYNYENEEIRITGY